MYSIEGDPPKSAAQHSITATPFGLEQRPVRSTQRIGIAFANTIFG